MTAIGTNQFPNVRGVVFDLDNTLYDHIEYVRIAYAFIGERLAQLYGVDADKIVLYMLALWRAHTSMWPHVFSNTLKWLGDGSGAREREMVELYHSCKLSFLPSYPGVNEALKLLRERYSLAVLTDGRPGTQRKKLAALGLGEYFNQVLVTGDLGVEYYKPHPESFRQLSLDLGLMEREFVYVGDNPAVDFSGARAAGYKTIRMRLGEFVSVEPKSHDEQADAEVYSYEELVRLLDA